MPRRSWYHTLSPLLTLLLTLGCTSWHPVTDPSPLAPHFAVNSKVRLTDSAGRRMAGINAVGRGTSIILTRRDWTWDSMPRRQVTLVEMRRFDAGKTLGRTVMVGMGGFLALMIIIQAADPCLAAFC